MDDGLNKGLTYRAIAAGLAAAGGSLDPKVVSRHREAHWVKPVDPDAPKPTSRDLAIMVRDKVADAVSETSGEAILLMGKELAPALNAGLKAQTILDRRDATERKLGIAAGALSLQAWLAGLGERLPPPELDDGNTIEGEAVEVLHTEPVLHTESEDVEA